MPSRKHRALDLAVIIGLYAASIFPSTLLVFLPTLALDILWFVVPVVYLSWRTGKNLRTILPAAFFIGLLGFSLDIILLHNYAWTPYRSDFTLRIFGVPPEEALWFFFHVFYIIVWYEHFIDDERAVHASSKRLATLAWFSVACFGLVLIAVYAFPDAARIRYAYGILAACAMVPITAYLWIRRTALFKKIFPVAAFFFPFALIMEIRALQLGLWSFPDIKNYLGLITIFDATFPMEEILFWMTLGPIVAIAYYELFADDGL